MGFVGYAGCDCTELPNTALATAAASANDVIDVLMAFLLSIVVMLWRERVSLRTSTCDAFKALWNRNRT